MMKTNKIQIIIISTMILFAIFCSGCIEEEKDNDNENGNGKTSQLIAHYHFDEGNGNEAVDSSNYGNDGSIYGAKWVSGINGTALEFDGKDDYIEVPDSKSLDIDKKVSIEAWVKPKSLMDDGEGVVCKSNNIGTSPVYGIYIYYGGMAGFQIFTKDIGVFGLSTNFSLPINNWSHIVGTYDGSKMKIYLNGINKMTINLRGTGIIETNDQKLYIGFHSGNIKKYFNGTIDEIRIYNNVLSSSEIDSHYREFQ